MAREPNGAVLRQVRLLYEAGPLTFWGDGALLDAFVSRQDSAGEAAFTALVERHGPLVLRVCRAVLRDEHGAHDAFQATFLVLARRARSVRVGETLGPWLHGVAWRTAMRARAASERRRRHERRAAEMASRTVEPAVNADDAEALLHEEIRRLPERFRAAVVLCDLEGLTTDQAAAKLGLPVGTVRSRLSRGRDRLRIRLVRRGFTPAVVGLTVASGKVSAVVPTALVHLTVRAAVAYTWTGTVPVALGWLIRGGIDAMRIKGLAVLGMTAAVVASAGGMAAQVPGGGSTGVAVKQKTLEGARAELPPGDPDSDLERLQGRWVIIKASGPVGENPEGDLLTSVLTISGTTMTFATDTGKEKSRYRLLLDPGSSSGAMLVKHLDRPAQLNPPQWMIYAIEKDRLRLAFDDSNKPRRPKDFNDTPLAVLDLVRAEQEPVRTGLKAEMPIAKRADAKPQTAARSDQERILGRWRVTHRFSKYTLLDYEEGSVFAFDTGRLDVLTTVTRPEEAFRYTLGTEGKRKALLFERIGPGAAPLAGWILYDFTPEGLRLTIYQRLDALEVASNKQNHALAEFHLVRDDPEPTAQGPTPKFRAGDPAVRETPDDYGSWRRKIETEIAILEAKLVAKKAELQQGEAEYKVRQLTPMQAVLDKLEKPITLSFPKGAPLEQVLKAIRLATADMGGVGIPIYVDPNGLQEVKKDLASPVTIDLEAVPAKICLRLILKQLGLGYQVQDGLLTITSQAAIDRPTGGLQ